MILSLYVYFVRSLFNQRKIGVRKKNILILYSILYDLFLQRLTLLLIILIHSHPTLACQSFIFYYDPTILLCFYIIYYLNGISCFAS